MIRPRPQRQNRSGAGDDQYALESTQVKAPDLPGVVVALPTVDEIIDAVASDLVLHAKNCVRNFGDFHLALSGGRTPEPLYERLMYDPDFRQLPWRRTHLWQVDERCVPVNDERSNFQMIRETIVDHADIPPEQVHPMMKPAGGESHPLADVEYERELREHLGWREKGQDRLDYVLLGLGADGHTASLFPHTEPLRETSRLIRFNAAPANGSASAEGEPEDASADALERITMTFPLINSARFIAFLVTGESKQEAVRRVAQRDNGVSNLPALGVEPVSGELKWYLDAAACGQ